MKKILLFTGIALLVMACTQELTDPFESDGHRIAFSVVDINGVQVSGVETRAQGTDVELVEAPAPVLMESEYEMEEPFYLFTTVEEGIQVKMGEDIEHTKGALINQSEVTAAPASFLFGVSEYTSSDVVVGAMQNNNPTYNVTSTHYDTSVEWEESAYYASPASFKFYGYYPYIATAQTGIEQTSGLTLNSGYKTITYDAAGISVGNQPDLMSAYRLNGYTENAVSLAFGHRLCAVQFKLGGLWTNGFRITGISFTNVVSSGTLNLADGSWSSLGSPDDYTVSGFDSSVSTPNSVVAGAPSTYLMMIPQTLSSTKISITMTAPNSSVNVLSADVTGSWVAGKTVTYTITPQGIDMTIDYPSKWAGSYDGPFSTYSNGTDKFGLFAVDPTTHKIVLSNSLIDIASSGAAPTFKLPMVSYNASYDYFLMYPYLTNDQLSTLVTSGNYNSHLKEDATLTADRHANADAFFADVISNWSVLQNQSSDIKSSDLQVGNYSAQRFTMVHKMSLAKITLSSASVPSMRTYNGNDGTTSDASNVSVVASNAFDNTGSYITPYHSAGNDYYYIARYDTTPQLHDGSSLDSSSPTEDYAKWTTPTVTIQTGGSTALGQNGYAAFSILSKAESRGWKSYETIFPYSGNMKTFTADRTGQFTIECWGADGGGAPFVPDGQDAVTDKVLPGLGGYTKGDIGLTYGQELYVYVGQAGQNTIGRNKEKASALAADANYNAGGWNGGGHSSRNNGFNISSSGGGGTDVRLVKADPSDATVWKKDASLRTRIMVAGGGGGCGYVENSGWNMQTGGCGGGLIGGNSTSSKSSYQSSDKVALGGSQTQARTNVVSSDAGWSPEAGFGYASTTLNEAYYGAGGAGGWWGGQKGGGNGGAGGSSFISGHPGCVAVDTSTGAPLSYTGADYASDPSPVFETITEVNYATYYATVYSAVTYIFTNTLMIDGDGYSWSKPTLTREYVSSTHPGVVKDGEDVWANRPGLPTNPAATDADAGGYKNGYCKITFVSE